MYRRPLWWLGALAAVSAALFAASAAAERAHVGYPDSIVVLGHSGATGFNSDPQRPDVDVPANSWATGSNREVRSLYLRILEANPAIRGHNVNLARNGARVSDVVGQAGSAVARKRKPELVVIQILDNDIRCDGTDPSLYRSFRATFVRALVILSRRLPNARIYVVHSWGRPATYVEAIKDIPEARAPLTGTGRCDLFDSAGRVRPDGVAYLTKVVEGYEAQLRAGCARFVHCRWDGGALARLVDDRADLSSDWGHPSIHGHTRIAEYAWSGIFNFADTTPPLSKSAVSRRAGTRVVTLSATDAEGVAGIEYKVVPPKRTPSRVAYRRYAAPVPLARGSSFIWRAVDVNGNSEATHSLRG
jgi:GDSL-like lipase/acylhydrolase family protein